jgi:hypothetical protein
MPPETHIQKRSLYLMANKSRAKLFRHGLNKHPLLALNHLLRLPFPTDEGRRHRRERLRLVLAEERRRSRTLFLVLVLRRRRLSLEQMVLCPLFQLNPRTLQKLYVGSCGCAVLHR